MDSGFLQHTTLALTSQPDGHSLTRELIAIIDDTGWVGSVALLEAYLAGQGDADDAEAQSGGSIVRRFDPDLGLAHRVTPDLRGVHEALARDQPVAIPARGNEPSRIVLPVRARGNPQRLLVLDSPSEDPLQRMQLMHLAELYGNQLRLIDSRERDQLTGLLNRQAFTNCFLQLTDSRAAALGSDLWLAVLDIDHFKRVNDTFGHLIGDEVLLRFARIMECCFRYTDRLFRFGGEEFLVLMRCDGDGAGIALERFRAAVENYEFPKVGQLTVSAGFVCARHSMLAPDLVDIADQALYQAKRDGRNQVVMAAPLGVEERAAGEIELF